jgi:DNA-binding FadR family transcriptional regulator
MPKTLEPLVRAPLLHRTVQEAIKEFVLDNDLRPGDMLPPETELARQLGVSRTSVREAVKALESLGLLAVRRGSGLFVREFSLQPLIENLSYGVLFDLQALAEIMEIRRVLESGMVEETMTRMPETTLADLHQVVARMGDQAEQGNPFFAEDRRFHQLLFAPLGNATLLNLLDVFWLTFNQASVHADLRDTNPARTYRDHVAILEAIAARDVEGARWALDQHYDGLKERLARARQAREG